MKLAIQILLFAVAAVLVRGQPANDAFTNRVVLSGTNITLEGTVNGATIEDGEPHEYSDERSVWFLWRAPSDGLVFLSGSGPCPGTGCPPIMGVYTGEGLTNLTIVVTNAMVPERFEREGTLRFEVKSGVEYLIRVARSGEGAFSLSLGLEDFWVQYPTFGADLDVTQEVLLKMSPLPAGRVGEFSHVGFHSNSGLIGVAEGPDFELRVRDLIPGEHYVGGRATNAVGEVLYFPWTRFTLSAKGGQGRLAVPEDRWMFPPFVALSGTYGLHYTLETSEDLVTWKVHSTDWLKTSPTLVSDVVIAGPGEHTPFPPMRMPKKFYRLKIH